MHDASIDTTTTKVGYEILLERRFCRYKPPRSLEDDIVKRLKEVMA